ncbi:MAG: hypothetical protein K8R59_06605 [Thermoanaerobaculales bacterium]|nr:hypothetical protein [Thermoanaerobaculales bacterium]
MVFFNYALRKLNAKIVYYGPGLCGKTTNLQWIHDHFEGGEKGKMVSLATEGDRTIFFDLLPLEIGKIRSMDVTLQLYTVPGQVHYNSTRQLVLRGADGVVFVADSQRTMQGSNSDSLRNLEENLSLQGIELKTFPHILQFNKRDLSSLMGVEEMDSSLNRFDAPIFESVAVDGIGVQESLEGIVKLVMRSLKQRYESREIGVGPVAPEKPRAPAAAGPWPTGLPSSPPRSVPESPVASFSGAGARPAQASEPPVAVDPTEETAVYSFDEPEVETGFSGLPADSGDMPEWDANEITGQSMDFDVSETRGEEPDIELAGPAADQDPANDITAVDISSPFGNGEPPVYDIEESPEEVDTHTGILVPTELMEKAEEFLGEMEPVDEPDAGVQIGTSEPPMADLEAPDGDPLVIDEPTAPVPDHPREIEDLVSSVLHKPIVKPEEPVIDSVVMREPEIEKDQIGAEAVFERDEEPTVPEAFTVDSGPEVEFDLVEEETDGSEELEPFAIDETALEDGPAVSAPTRQPILFDDGDPFSIGVDAGPIISASVKPSPVEVSAEANSLALKLTGTGAIVESGQVRALDIEVPVPGSWVGNQKVTLQLRLTLSPVSEDEDEGNSGPA